RGPHQRVFETGLVPEIAAYPPAFVIRHEQKDNNGDGNESGEQAESEHRTGHELGERDGRRPEFSRTIAVAVELFRQFTQIVRLHARRRKQAERVAQPVWNKRKPHHGAQQRLGPRQERLIDRPELREDECRGVNHLRRVPRPYSDDRDYSLISPRLILAPSWASTDFLLCPFAEISTTYGPESSSSLSNLKSP